MSERSLEAFFFKFKETVSGHQCGSEVTKVVTANGRGIRDPGS